MKTDLITPAKSACAALVLGLLIAAAPTLAQSTRPIWIKQACPVLSGSAAVPATCWSRVDLGGR